MITIPYILGLISSWHGGNIAIPHDSKVLKSIVWCVPFAAAILVYCPLWMLCFVPLCLLKAMGHGRGFRLKEPMIEGDKPEKIEWLILPLMSKIPLYCIRFSL